MPRRCVRCGKDPDKDKLRVSPMLHPPLCSRCFFSRLALRHTKTRANWKLIRELWHRQKGLCAYTGEKLVLGETATLDHRQPKSRGGSNRVDNLQWVSARINEFKGSRTHEEFLDLCRRVTRYAEGYGRTDHGE